nr:twin-arginine translocation signal domain-containing protein [Klebsiella pneumoniae]
MSNQESPGGVSRRALLKSTALGSLALAAGGQRQGAEGCRF